jgi:hypothetical protein
MDMSILIAGVVLFLALLAGSTIDDAGFRRRDIASLDKL